MNIKPRAAGWTEYLRTRAAPTGSASEDDPFGSDTGQFPRRWLVQLSGPPGILPSRVVQIDHKKRPSRRMHKPQWCAASYANWLIENGHATACCPCSPCLCDGRPSSQLPSSLRAYLVNMAVGVLLSLWPSPCTHRHKGRHQCDVRTFTPPLAVVPPHVCVTTLLTRHRVQPHFVSFA